MSSNEDAVDHFDGAAGHGVLVSDPSLMLHRILQNDELHNPSSPISDHNDLLQSPIDATVGQVTLGQEPDLLMKQNAVLNNGSRNLQQQHQQEQQQSGTTNEQLSGDENAEQKFYNDVLGSFDLLGGGAVKGAKDIGVTDAMAAFGFNAFLFIIFVGIYEVFYRWIPNVYACRNQFVTKDRVVLDNPRSILPLSWIPVVCRISWESVRKTGGLDAYFFLRFIRLCGRIIAVSGIWAMLVLFPVFSSGGEGAEGWYHFSMANLPQDDWRIWFPTIFMWFLTFYVFFAMNEEYKHFLELRVQYLTEGEADVSPQKQHSLLIEEIPRELRSEKALYAYFDSLFPGKVNCVSVVLNIPDLEIISAKRKRAVRRLEKSIAHYEATGKRVTHVVGRKRLICCGIETYPVRNFGGKIMVEEDDNRSPEKGERVDSIAYYTHQLLELNEATKKMQTEKQALATEGNNSDGNPWFSQIIDNDSDSAGTTEHGKRSCKESLYVAFRSKKGICGVIRRVCLDFLFGGFTFLNRNIDVVVDSVSGSPMSSTAFVTFNDLTTVACAMKAPLSHDPNTLLTAAAPDPRDIQWMNAHINFSYAKGRSWTANFFLVFGAILWSIPVASIQAWATADVLATVPGFHWMASLDGGGLYSFINGYLPVIALLTIITLQPRFFQWVALNLEYRKTETEVQKSILERYFYYQLANVYITVTAGSIWTSLGTILDHPGSVLEIMGKSVPTVVGYFITFVMTKTLAGLPVVLLRMSAFLRYVFLRLFFRQSLLTQRELDEVYKPRILWSGFEYPNQLLVLVICFTYACISPIILPFGMLYFFGALAVYKKQVLLVYTPIHESGGSVFPSVCRRMLIGLICGQVTLTGYTIMREAYYQPLALLPLPILTVLMMQSFTRLYDGPAAQLSLERAKKLDKDSMVRLQFTETFFRQPVLAEGKEEPLPYRIDRTAQQESVERNIVSFQQLGVLHEDTGRIV